MLILQQYPDVTVNLLLQPLMNVTISINFSPSSKLPQVKVVQGSVGTNYRIYLDSFRSGR